MNDYSRELLNLEAGWADGRKAFWQQLLEANRPDVLAEYDQAMRDLDTGVTGARNCWHSISPAQRLALTVADQHGGRLTREGKAYYLRYGGVPYRPIYARTVRGLCGRDLMAWDGGLPDPELSAVVTERGRFVLGIAKRG